MNASIGTAAGLLAQAALAVALLTVLRTSGCLPDPPPDTAPLVNFGAVPLSGPAPLTVTFNNVTDLQGETLVSYAWEFGDGATSADPAPTYTYSEPGLYAVRLTATSTGGTAELLRDNYITVREGMIEPVEGEGGGEGDRDGEGMAEGEGSPGGEGAPDGEGTVEGEGALEGEMPVAGEVRVFDDMEFVWIPPGAFTMGTDRTADELEETYGDRAFFFRSEQPAHVVTLTQGFWFGRFEVTQEEWLRYVSENPSLFPDDDRPVERVSWEQAVAFIEALNAGTGGGYRLPTEAEWEYACRAGTTTEFSFGDDPDAIDDYAWIFSNAENFSTEPVGRLSPNPWGLFDIHGNVFEWCSDWYDTDYYADSPPVNPPGPAEGTLKVRRGGSFTRTEAFCRCSFRLWNGPSAQLETTGLRLVRSATD